MDEVLGAGGGKGLGYEPDPHRRTIATFAVIGGVLALVPLLLTCVVMCS
ncbi:hypothetical protein K8O92_25050 [Nocardia asteroides]|nr:MULTISPECIES: hypothetical protein [Nocardia]MBF6208986.1 hypothetical protein [Streptomyces gardneri]UAK31094.1 hypothetical protein K8O92_25050 [Nocardia asteroides]